MRVQLLERASEVDADEWRTLAGSAFYVSREWLESFAALTGARRRVVLVTARATPVAALPCWAVADGHPNARYDLRRLYEDASGTREDPAAWGRQLLGGSASGYENRLLLRPGLDAETARLAVGELARVFRETGDEWGCAAAGLLYLDRHSADRLAPELGPRTVSLLTGATCRLAIAWPDFEGYLGSLKSSRRAVVRRDLAEVAAGGATVTRASLAGSEMELARLLSAVQRRHGVDESPEDAQRFLESWATPELDAMAVVFRCERDGALVAFSLGFVSGGTLAMRVVGLDHERAVNGEYFQTLFYEPIRYAAEHGLTSIGFGTDSYRAKLLRGCEAEPLWSLVLPPEGVAPAADEVERWNAAALERWQDELGPLVGELPLAEWAYGGR